MYHFQIVEISGMIEENYSIQQSHITLKKKQTKEKQNKINNKKNMTRNTSPLSDPRKKAKHPPPHPHKKRPVMAAF